MNRRGFLTSALAVAGGLMVPEWLLEPLKGRSMVSVPALPSIVDDNVILFKPKMLRTFSLGFVVTSALIDDSQSRIIERIRREQRLLDDTGIDDWITGRD